MAGEPATNSDKPQSEDPSGGDQHMPLDESAERAAAESDCEDELLVIPEDSAGGLPPAYDSKAKR